MKKLTHGGRRAGAGAKKKPYQTTTVSFRVRVEQAEPVKVLVKKYLSKLPAQN